MALVAEWPSLPAALPQALEELEREARREGTAFQFMLNLYRRLAERAPDDA